MMSKRENSKIANVESSNCRGDSKSEAERLDVKWKLVTKAIPHHATLDNGSGYVSQNEIPLGKEQFLNSHSLADVEK